MKCLKLFLERCEIPDQRLKSDFFNKNINDLLWNNLNLKYYAPQAEHRDN